MVKNKKYEGLISLSIFFFDQEKKKQKKKQKIPEQKRTLSEREIKEFTSKFNEVARTKYLSHHRVRNRDEH